MSAESQDIPRPAARPLVSVVTPFLNAAKFLEEAIVSVQRQTLPAWELLLVDDGSIDHSSQLARDYAQRFPSQIRYFEHAGHRNLGKSVSRNLGIARARGPYVTFLDADDVLFPHKLERQVQLLEQHPQAGMVYGMTEYWTSWDRRRGLLRKRDRRVKLGLAPDRLYGSSELVTLWLRKPGVVPCLCAALARTDLVRSVGAYDENIQDLYEDQIFLVKMSLAAEVYVESGCGERYRQHAESSSAQAVKEGRYHPLRPNQARLTFLEWLREYLQARQALTGGLAHALNAALRPYRHPMLYRALYPLTAVAARFRG